MAAQPIKCPECGGNIKKVGKDTDLIKCENNQYKNGKQCGCTFMMNLSPKPLSGYTFSRNQVIEMIGGKAVNVNGVTATYQKEAQYNPCLVFPEPEDF